MRRPWTRAEGAGMEKRSQVQLFPSRKWLTGVGDKAEMVGKTEHSTIPASEPGQRGTSENTRQHGMCWT